MRVTVIAEAGVNHNGDLGRALEMVDAAARAGADVVKFQTFRAAALASASAPKAAYQVANDGAESSQLEMLKRLELSAEQHHAIAARCLARGIRFLSTPFDPASLAFLVDEMGIDLIKVPSGEITNAPFLLAVAHTGLRVILSTGMSTLDEVREALAVLALGLAGETRIERAGLARVALDGLAGRVTLLHCTTEYPCPIAEVNLRAMDTLRREFGLPVGLSDHSTGITAAIAAAAMGATVIEKHFTLDRTLPGPDHKASLEPDELGALVCGLRDVEAALGDGAKAPSPSERENMAVARKSLVALTPIARGQPLTEANLGIRRAGAGISPMEYWSRLGGVAGRDYRPGEAIEP